MWHQEMGAVGRITVTLGQATLGKQRRYMLRGTEEQAQSLQGRLEALGN